MHQPGDHEVIRARQVADLVTGHLAFARVMDRRSCDNRRRFGHAGPPWEARYQWGNRRRTTHPATRYRTSPVREVRKCRRRNSADQSGVLRGEQLTLNGFYTFDTSQPMEG